jgi:hypothetical protein
MLVRESVSVRLRSGRVVEPGGAGGSVTRALPADLSFTERRELRAVLSAWEARNDGGLELLGAMREGDFTYSVARFLWATFRLLADDLPDDRGAAEQLLQLRCESLRRRLQDVGPGGADAVVQAIMRIEGALDELLD